MPVSLHRFSNGKFLRDATTGHFPLRHCCSCACLPDCVWAIITFTAPAPVETPMGPVAMQLDAGGGWDEDPGDPAATKCSWEIRCNPSDDHPQVWLTEYWGGYYNVAVRIHGIDDDVWLSDDLYTGPYGTYVFQNYPSSGLSLMTVTISERDSRLHGNAYVCASYVKAGETWDVVRLCLRGCMLPEPWSNGWQEDGPEGEPDFFNVHVETIPISCANCIWDASWVGQLFCATLWMRSYGGDWVEGDTFSLIHCGFWPSDSNAAGCILYNTQISKWVRYTDSDADTLSVRWDGVWEYNFFGGSSVDNTDGPYGWYEFGDTKVQVYECPP
jgi:hypothetical protein